MKLKIKRGLIALTIGIIATVLGLLTFFEIHHRLYIKKITKMKSNQELLVHVSSSVQHKTLSLEDYKIHYYVSGKRGADLIVFLHPAFSDHQAFDQQIDFFSKKYRVISVDMIGHGLSQPNRIKDQINASHKHIKDIIKQEGYETTHIVGVSLGSLIAQYFAFNYPNQVKSLTALGGYSIHKKSDEVTKAQSSVNIGLIIRALFSMNAFRQKAAGMSCNTEKGKALFYESSKQFTRRSFRVMQGIQEMIQDRAHIKPKYPTLILTGELDIELAQKMSRDWHQNNDNSQYFCIKDAGHCANIDQPDMFNELLDDFISNQSFF